MDNNIIELQHIKKSYVQDIEVIKDFNLEVKKGEFVTFLGPSGCGKTTILRMIGGFELPSSGKILLNGKDISTLPPNERPVNTVFQKYALFPFLNIYDNIAFGLKLKNLSKKEIDEKVKHVLEVVDLEGFEKRAVSTLSGGQQQRIAIARAIVNEPQILLLDEPLGALDYKMRIEMQLELKAMHENLGITFIFVTHDQEEALTMSDKIVVMEDGKIQQIGTPEEIYKRPKNVFVADFIGESNIFDGIMTDTNKVKICDTVFETEKEYQKNSKIDAMIRPEKVQLVPVYEGKISGSVISSNFKGIYHEITVLSGKNEIVAHSQKAWERDTLVGVNIPPEAIHIMAYDEQMNHHIGIFDSEMMIHFDDLSFTPDYNKIYPGSVVEGGKLVAVDGSVIAVEGAKVDVFFDPKDAQLSDDIDAGMVKGKISSIIYKGDHYSYLVKSKNDLDYYVDDEYLWNIDDHVSVLIPRDKLEYSLAVGGEA